MALVDPYTMELRLCDDQGMVSHEPIRGEEIATADKSYLDRLNRLRSMSKRLGLIGCRVAHDQPATSPASVNVPIGRSINGWQVFTCPGVSYPTAA